MLNLKKKLKIHRSYSHVNGVIHIDLVLLNIAMDDIIKTFIKGKSHEIKGVCNGKSSVLVAETEDQF